MSDSFSPGDIQVQSFSITSKRGNLDLTKSFVSASIYESIFTPGIVCDITVLDTDDILGTMKISGDEDVKIKFKTPGGASAEYKFGLYTLEASKTVTASTKSKTFVVKAVSQEALHAKTNIVSKSFNTQISNMVKTIHKEYMHSDKQIEVEETKGSQKIVIPSFNPFKAIDMVRKRAISGENKSSLFVFFETRNGSTQIFKFTTIEKLFKGGSVKTFKQSDAINNNMNNKTDDQILALETPALFNSSDSIKAGGKRKTIEFDITTHAVNTSVKETKSTDYSLGGSGPLVSDDFKSKYINKAKNQPYTLIPNDSTKPKTGIKESTPDQQAYLAALMQNSIKMRVYGDFKLKAGDVITANIPTKTSTTGPRSNDPLMSGKFLISRVHHDIGTAGDKPRYTCVIECLKGNVEKGV
jgi:hypothetical protein